jgi:transcription elongation factor/antiterminator RfaH
MERWYTLYTKPRAEYQVRTVLQERDIQTYLPEIELPKAAKGCDRKPFFSCYMFARVDLKTISISSIQWIPGLRRVVSIDGWPVPLADEVINLIRYKLGQVEANGDQPLYPFKVGDTVRITTGPFQDMLAIFDKPTTSAERVQVLLDILGQASRVQVNAIDLEQVPDGTEIPLAKRPRRTRGRGRRVKGISWSSSD